MEQYKNELEKLIRKKCYDNIYKKLYEYVRNHPNSLKLGRYCLIKYPDAATLKNMFLEFVTNISIYEDNISCDAVVSCQIEIKEKLFKIFTIKTDIVRQWFRINCSVAVEDSIKSFNIRKIEPYSKKEKNKTEFVATGNLVPIISKEQLDDEAERFLKKYCPEALVTPMPVPINEIVRDKMRLSVITENCLTDDFSIFGQLCFSKGVVKIYDAKRNNYREMDVERGTILVDTNTLLLRNIGCVNNTITHEAFHWHRHRVYASVRSILRGEKFIAYRCPVEPNDNKSKKSWTDKNSMEWQANKIAPRILMPRATTDIKIKELLQKYGYSENSNKKILESVVNDLASFYKVSKEAAKIRMIDLGYGAVATVFNYEKSSRNFTNVNLVDVFYEYCVNEIFRNLVDSELFCYADGQLVINDGKYVRLDENNNFQLTDYAMANIAECALQFTYVNVNLEKQGQLHTDPFHRKNPQGYTKLPHYSQNLHNISIIDNAEELHKKKAEFEVEFAEYTAFKKTFCQRVYELMRVKKWNSAIFTEKTLLNKMTYSRIKNNESNLPSIETVIAICLGLNLNISFTNELLALAGHTLTGLRKHQAYAFLITNFRGKSIYECNEFLEELEIEPLGTKERT